MAKESKFHIEQQDVIFYEPFLSEFDVRRNGGNPDAGATSSGGIGFTNNGAPGWTGALINLYANNIIVNGGHCIKNEIPITGRVVAKNNIFSNRVNDSNRSCIWNSGIAGATSCDYNFYDRTGAAGTVPWVIDGSTWYQTDYVNHISGYDPHYAVGDPDFVTEFTDLHLNIGSGAINAGLKIAGFDKDFEGVTYEDPPDQGIFETEV